jgi:hypothetical protein
VANIYVRSTTGSNANSGADWSHAKATLAGAAAIAVAGDNVFVSQVHAESTASTVTINWAGTFNQQINILCVQDSATPPTTLATTATVAVTGSSNFNNYGSVYVYTFNIGSSTIAASMNQGIATANWQRYEQCVFVLANTNTGSRIGITSAANVCCRIEWIGCQVKFGNASQRIGSSGPVNFWWNNNGAAATIAGTSTPNTQLIDTFDTGAKILVEDCDFSLFGTGLSFFSGTIVNNGTYIVRNCETPSSWTGNICSGTPTGHARAELWNSWYNANDYQISIMDMCGTVTTSTSVARTGGASDGYNLIALKMTTTTDVTYPAIVFSSPEIAYQNATVGSSRTVSFYSIANTATAPNNDQLWIEVQELGNASQPIGSRITNQKTDFLTTAAAQTADTSAWDSQTTARANSTSYALGDPIKVATNPGRVFFCTSSGMSAGSEPAGYATAVDGGAVTDGGAVFRAGWRQVLAVTFTPQLKGSFNSRFKWCASQSSVFVDFKPVVT